MGSEALSALDIAVGTPLPDDVPADRRFQPEPTERFSTPLLALEAVIRPLLQRPPCFVAFSGGRDSSAVLAVAVDLARREGHPEPVPLTLVFPYVESSDEGTYQRMVLEYLAITERVQVVTEPGQLELLGPEATRLMESGGVFWPVGSHLIDKLFSHASGGSLLTGEGGDQVFTLRRPPLWHGVRTARTKVDLARAVVPRLPPVGGVERLHARLLTAPRWLKPAAAAEAKRSIARFDAGLYRHDAPAMLWAMRHGRFTRMVLQRLDAMSDAHDVRLAIPLYSPEFFASYAPCLPPTGMRSRTAAMTALFGHLLPRDLLSRKSKANFTDVLFGERTLDFLDRTDGGGIDETKVELGVLLDAWSSGRPPLNSALLAQVAWLQHRASGGE